jgi:hypothetical protein
MLMATPAEPVTGALFQALSSPEPDPQVVHAAIEEVRQIASQNVIAVLGAQITELKAEMKVGFAEVKAEFTKVNSRIDTLEKVVWRVIWPLIGLLATTVFGLLYRVLTS